MAAEVPAKDVLCEAMEYLSKLGSNLRTRSENLKDKKIRREKLNNVLAVQKAATKVLLICELSKKSLENVETGVRKVLEYIDTSQKSSRDGAKISKTDHDGAESKKYYYFEYKSRKLRIKKRISLKYYTSVRVIARSMLKSMIDKYPVHYDCKLYRMRQREKKLQDPIEDSDHDTDKIIQKESSGVKVTENKENSESQGNNMSVISIPDTPSPKSKADKNLQECSENQDMSVISIPDTPSSKSNVCDKKDSSTENDDKKKRKNCSESSSKQRSQSRDSYQSPSKIDKKRIKSADDHHQSRRNSCESKSDSSSKSNKNSEKKKVKRRIIADSSDDDKKSDKEPDPKKRKLSQTNDKKQSEDSSGDNTGKDKEQSDDHSKKPLIKCVSLSKLLKPNVLKKGVTVVPKAKVSSGSKETIKYNEKEAEKLVSKQCEEEDKKAEQLAQKERESEEAEKIVQKQREEEEYWLQKRKEVSAFESKSFVINVTRLPELTVNYVNQLGLRKITKGGITVCEMDVNVDNLNVNNKVPKSKTRSNGSRQSSSNEVNDDDLIAEANKVKNSLLNESDSDGDAFTLDNKLIKSSKENTENIKSALLNDSDSDNSSTENGSKTVHAQRHTRDLLSNESDSDSNKSGSKTMAAQAELKNKLLNESGSDLENKRSKNTTQLEKGNNKNYSCSNSEDKHVKDTPQTAEAKDSDSENKTSTETAQSRVSKKTVLNDSNSESNSKKHSDSELEEGTESCNSRGKSKIDGSLGGKDSDNDKDKKKQQDKNDVVEQIDENLTQSQINEKTPEKESSPGDSDDKMKTPLSQRMTPQSKKKRMRESVHAKKMLLTYSSSDTEDEQLKDVLKEIKHALLHGSDEENSPKKHEEKHHTRNSSPSSSGEDILKKAKKNRSDSHSSKAVKVMHRRKKHCRRLDSGSSSNNSKTSSSKVRSENK